VYRFLNKYSKELAQTVKFEVNLSFVSRYIA